uniref:ORF62 n=1 Tax=Cydia pomonella granulosis virus TaxID=28289 RepID=A0A6B9I719_GVCP|nr:ORF62 [Cydia pomonella granulovirus]
MSSLKELHHEIIKTQQDIAVTYRRVVGVENELKRKLDEYNKSNSIDERLNNLQEQLGSVLNLLKEKEVVNEKKVVVKEDGVVDEGAVINAVAVDEHKSKIEEEPHKVQEEPRVEEPHKVQEEPRVDEPRVDEPRVDEPRVDEPHKVEDEPHKSTVADHHPEMVVEHANDDKEEH